MTTRTGRADSAGAWLGAGALSSALAVMATWVCCLPLLAGLLGAGVASFGFALEPYRPYLLLAGAGFVGLGLWRSYRRRPACDGDQCRAGSPWQRIVLWLSAVAIVVAAALPYALGLWAQARI